MNRRFAAFRMTVLSFAAAGLFAAPGCQKPPAEPVSEGPKYEVEEEDGDSGSATTATPSAGAGGVADTTASGSTTPIGDQTAGVGAGGETAGGSTIPMPNPAADTTSANESTPSTQPAAANSESNTATNGAGGTAPGRTAEATNGAGSPAANATASGPAGPADQAGQQVIPFAMPREEGITMASYAPPENAKPNDLVDHLKQLSKVALKGNNQQEQMADLFSLLQQRVRTCEELMNAPGATLDERMLGVNTKLETLRILQEMGHPDVLKHAMTFAAALKRHPTEEMARKGRVIYLSLAASELPSSPNADPKWVAEEVKAIVNEEPPSAEICEAAQRSIGMLMRIGAVDLANQGATELLKNYSSSEDPQIKLMLTAFKDEMGLLSLGFANKLQGAMENRDGAVASLVAAAEKAATLDTRGQATIQVLVQSGQFMELAGHYDAAEKIYGALETGFKDWSDKELAEDVMTAVKTARKRLALIGQPFSLEGKTVDGETLDWNKYKGKVVLVDFWATWCIPCLEEMPNILAHYQQYKDRGFEVIGYNLDEDPKQVAAFFDSQELPWPSLMKQDAENRGFGKDPFASSLGIDAIPFVMLINREGKVEAIHVRGMELTRQLERLIGPPNPPKKESDKEAPATDESGSQ